MMFSLRSIFFRPKKSEYPLAKFFYADLELRRITADLDSFDGKKEPIRCQKLLDRLKKTQQRVMDVIWAVVRICISDESRQSHQYREKFPEELRGDHMTGPLWFGAECLTAGSSVQNRERESDELRPLARRITQVIEEVRMKLREQCLCDVTTYPEDLVDILRDFDKKWAEFEFSYVSRMCPIKTPEELQQQHLTTILFSETTAQALKDKIIAEEMMSSYDPALMLAIPRLSILFGLEQDCGLLDLERRFNDIPVYFKPHISILADIKSSVSNLTPGEYVTLKECLASSQDPLQTETEAETEGRDVLHCLYLAVSSIADQMITKHAKDLRQMLQHTFKMNQPFEPSVNIVAKTSDELRAITTRSDCIEPSTSADDDVMRQRHHVIDSETCIDISGNRLEPPVWVPDSEVTCCTNCDEHFTLIRRKHHCRHCGQIFCQSCSGKAAVLMFTQSPVRVCDTCYSVCAGSIQRTSQEGPSSSLSS